MKLSLPAVALLTAIMSGSAFAADMPLKAAPYVSSSWTGAYWGLTLGWGYLDSTVTNSAAGFCNPALGGCPDFGPALAGAIPASIPVNPNGFLGGVEFGYNWQVGRLVYGVETDFSGANIDGSTTTSLVSTPSGVPPPMSWQRQESGSLILGRSAPGSAGLRPIRCCSMPPAAWPMVA